MARRRALLGGGRLCWLGGSAGVDRVRRCWLLDEAARLVVLGSELGCKAMFYWWLGSSSWLQGGGAASPCYLQFWVETVGASFCPWKTMSGSSCNRDWKTNWPAREAEGGHGGVLRHHVRDGLLRAWARLAVVAGHQLRRGRRSHRKYSAATRIRYPP
jgi:hypothetical protein